MLCQNRKVGINNNGANSSRSVYCIACVSAFFCFLFFYFLFFFLVLHRIFFRLRRQPKKRQSVVQIQHLLCKTCMFSFCKPLTSSMYLKIRSGVKSLDCSYQMIHPRLVLLQLLFIGTNELLTGIFLFRPR